MFSNETISAYIIELTEINFDDKQAFDNCCELLSILFDMIYNKIY